MYSLNLNYVFDKIYDGILWFKYAWYFIVLDYDNEKYLDSVQGEVWDGLRDRGWLDGTADVPGDKVSDALSNIGIDLNRDNDGDGIPNIRDTYPNDPNNFSNEKIKELFYDELSFDDKVRSFFGFDVQDMDGDGVPDSVEKLKGMNINNPDTDSDGVYDGEEVYKSLDPNNPDTDGDGVVDGRDAYPFDKYKKIFESDIDTDGDGVGDRFEKILGTDSLKIDTDGDGLRDGIDPHPFVAENKLQSAANITTSFTDGLTFAIQNKFLAFLADALTVLTLFTLPFFIFVFLKWFWKIKEANEHYYHTFHNAYGYKEIFGGGHHEYIDDLKNHKNENKTHDSHIHHDSSNAPDHNKSSSHTISSAPKEVEYVQHPKWAIVKSYMSENDQVFWRMGIIEADSMLDSILTERGALGIDLGDKLKSVKLVSINDAWEAHKVRNRIAHEGSNYNLSERDARLAFNAYERVFTELKVI